MKKICSLLLVMVLLLAQGVKAAPLTQPDPGKTYMIQHSSMMFMTVSGSSIQINVAGEGDTQKVTFIPVEGQEGIYNILFDNGKYLGTDTGWTAKLMDDPSDHMTWFQFRQSYLEDWMLVYNIGHEEAAGGGNNCFGTDNNSAGGGVYTNKGGNDGKHLWNIVEATDGVILTGLETAIATAEGVLSSVTVGNEAGCYPQDAYDTLAAAVETAKGFLSSTSQAEVNAAGEALNAAVNEFYTKRFVFVPKAGQKYYFVNVSTDMMMDINGGGEAILNNPSGADTQKFEIEPVEGSNIAFNLKIADGSGYLARKGSWNTTTVADPTVNEAKIEFEIVDLANNVYTLKKLNAWGYMAADSDAPGSLVYTDKSNGHWTAKWQIREAVEGEMILIALERAIANAESYLAKAVVGENPGNYPQEAVNALAAAVETAKAGLSAATQEEVNAAAAALNAAINEFLAAKIDPFFVPRENTPYRFSVRKYESNYMTNNGEAVGTSAFESNNAAQHWYFQPVADAKYTYIVKNDGKVLNYDGTVTETADAEAPLWTVVYTATINNIDYFAL
ncbi:MAG: FIVAR domain-containing protein, partial [Muribaculaceae bacterium]|nr:FIVAR domain-containing protein [Muribaculaceae bacterium]